MKKFQTFRVSVTVLLLSLLSTPGSFSQGSNWKITGNDNINSSHFLGSENNSTLFFRANNIEWLSISPTGTYKFNGLSGMGTGLFLLDNLGVASRLEFTGSSSDVLTGSGSFSSLSGMTGWTLSAPSLTTTYNVGIGTIEPFYPLTVEGNIFSTGTLFGTEIQIIEFVKAGKGFRINETLCIEGTSSDGINSICAENADLYINSKEIYGFNTLINTNNFGRVGIGTDAPMAKFHIFGNSLLDGNLDVSGETILDGDVEMGGIGTHSETENLQLLIKLPSGELKTVGFDTLIAAFVPPAELAGVFCVEDEDGNIPNPKWHSGLNKIYTDCDSVNVGIGTNNPTFKLRVNGITATTKLKAGNISSSSNAVINGFSPSQDLIALGKKVGALDEEVKFTISNNGSLTLNSDGPRAIIVNDAAGDKILQLQQDGLLKTRKVRVDLEVWSDYVFEKDYKLMSLKENKRFIAENKHLPGVPSGEEIKKDGLDLGSMQKIQMEKIEEIYLHMFEMNEAVTVLRREMASMQRQIDQLSDENKELKSQNK
ncbi:hypothetical protein JYT72_00075 [Crocinitomix catalasitica]|nr:hypothetical protein [Crocinitomix catalasitica]